MSHPAKYFIGRGNVYALVNGALMSTNLNADHTFHTDMIDCWCEVEAAPEENHEVREAITALTPTPTATAKYRFISDPGHGWLEVPLAEVYALGIQPSPYSYVSPDGHMAYLEEDCDAALFANAKWGDAQRSHSLTGAPLVTIPAGSITAVYEAHTAIRSYRRFPTEAERIAEGRAYIERHGLIRGTKS